MQREVGGRSAVRGPVARIYVKCRFSIHPTILRPSPTALETVTLLRRGSTPGAGRHGDRPCLAAGHHRRRGRDRQHAATFTSRSPAAGSNWPTTWSGTCPSAELPDAPRLGDVILDGDGHRWTILAVKSATLGARWRCETRNVAIAFGLDDTISVLKTVRHGDSGEPTWRTWKTGVRARIQPIETKIVTDADNALHDHAPIASSSRRTWTWTTPARIRGADGTIYTITGATGAERIGELQVIEAESSG